MLTGPTARHENSERRPASVDSCACARANRPPATMMMRAIGLSLNIARDVRASGGALSRDAPQCGMRSAKCGVNAECGVRSAECGVRSAECGVRTAECECLRGGCHEAA